MISLLFQSLGVIFSTSLPVREYTGKSFFLSFYCFLHSSFFLLLLPTFRIFPFPSSPHGSFLDGRRDMSPSSPLVSRSMRYKYVYPPLFRKFSPPSASHIAVEFPFPLPFIFQFARVVHAWFTIQDRTCQWIEWVMSSSLVFLCRVVPSFPFLLDLGSCFQGQTFISTQYL